MSSTNLFNSVQTVQNKKNSNCPVMNIVHYRILFTPATDVTESFAAM